MSLDELTLLDWRRRVYALYAEVRESPEPEAAWRRWRDVTRFTRFALALFAEHRLELYWLDAYGGGVFLPFRDETSGRETYGAGRYLLDTVKGADLGGGEGTLVLDFNFAYSPSCAWNDAWACPLAPPANRLLLRVEAGELAPE